MEEVPSLGSLPLGFRFHPTDEELISHYLKGKNNGRKPKIEVIPEIDVCKCEPWDLPEKSLIRTDDLEWFFFTPRDRKYPNGQRSNRATEAGYWKATGKDRKIKSRGSAGVMVIGMKKTLVFHRGRAPKGERTCWIMHEYRVVENDASGDPSENEGAYVLCRLFKKPDETNPQPISSPSANNKCPAIHNGEELEVLNHSGVNMDELLSTPYERTASQDVHRHCEVPSFKAEDDSNNACDIIGDRGLGIACSVNNNSDVVELDTSIFDHLVDLVPQDTHDPFAGLVSTNVNDDLNCSLLDNGYQQFHFSGCSHEGPICDLASGYGDGNCPLKSDLFSGNDIWPANVVDMSMLLQEGNENLPPSANDNFNYFPLSDYYKMERAFEPLVRTICNVVPMSNDSSDPPKSLQGPAKRRIHLEKRVRVPGLLRRINFNSCHLSDRSSTIVNEEQEDNQKRLRRVGSLRKRRDSMPSEIKRGAIKEVLHHSNKQLSEDHDYVCPSSIEKAFETKSNVMLQSVVYSTTSDETTGSDHSFSSILTDQSNSTNIKEDTWHEITTQPTAEDIESDVKSSVTAGVDPRGMLESRRLHVGRIKPCATIFGSSHALLIIGALPAVLLVLYVVLSNYFCLLDFICDGHQLR